MKRKKFLKELEEILEGKSTTDNELFHTLEQEKPQIQANLEEKLEKWAKDYFSEQLQEQRQKDKKSIESTRTHFLSIKKTY